MCAYINGLTKILDPSENVLDEMHDYVASSSFVHTYGLNQNQFQLY